MEGRCCPVWEYTCSRGYAGRNERLPEGAPIMRSGLPDLHLQFIVTRGGNTIHQVVIDPGAAVTAEGERVRAPEE